MLTLLTRKGGLDKETKRIDTEENIILLKSGLNTVLYHPECIDTWLSEHNNCPTCRKPI